MPKHWPLLELLTHWNTDVIAEPADPAKFDSLERLDYTKPEDRARAIMLRKLGIPHKLHSIPSLDAACKKWANTQDLSDRFGDQPLSTSMSYTNHLMFYHGGKGPDMMEWHSAARDKLVKGAIGHLRGGLEGVDTGTTAEAQARKSGYTYPHPPPLSSQLTFAKWHELAVEARDSVAQAAEAIAALHAQPPAGVSADSLWTVEALTPHMADALLPYIGAGLVELNAREQHAIRDTVPSAAGRPWGWWPLNVSDLPYAQSYPHAYLEFGSTTRLQPGDPVSEDLDMWRKPDTAEVLAEDTSGLRGPHCRFGAPGTEAAGHWDGHLNYILIMQGAKRYILAPPSECENFGIMPDGPSARHISWDLSDIGTLYGNNKAFAALQQAAALETVLRAGEALFVPSGWMHHIVSLTFNYQCNVRSGVSELHPADLSAMRACRGESSKQTSQRWWATESSWDEGAAEQVRASLTDTWGPELLQAAGIEASAPAKRRLLVHEEDGE